MTTPNPDASRNEMTPTSRPRSPSAYKALVPQPEGPASRRSRSTSEEGDAAAVGRPDTKYKTSSAPTSIASTASQKASGPREVRLRHQRSPDLQQAMILRSPIARGVLKSASTSTKHVRMPGISAVVALKQEGSKRPHGR